MIKGKGFYVALAVCLVSVGAAAFNTYKSVRDFSPTKQDLNSAEGTTGTETSDWEPVEYDAEKEIEQVDTKTEASEVLDDNTAGAIEEKEDKNLEQADANSSSAIISPVSKKVIKGYSKDNPVYSKTLNDWRVHNATDFEAEQGQKVRSMTDGVVKNVENDPLLGKTIVIAHNNETMAYYSGLGDTTFVKPKDKVTAGQEIGSINTVPSESADGYHLHLAIKRQGKWINPLEIIGQD
jgi:murein DD-endopeptidase MepM/ murein hydrolase activator NlpD